MTTSEYPGYTNPTGTAPSSIFDEVNAAYRQVDVDRLSPIEEMGQATFSGDGTATTFSINHTLGVAPSRAFIQAHSGDASGDSWVSNMTASVIEITFAAAPASGTDNIVLGYYARA
jgi:hypothetical protein